MFDVGGVTLKTKPLGSLFNKVSYGKEILTVTGNLAKVIVRQTLIGALTRAVTNFRSRWVYTKSSREFDLLC